MNTPPKPKAKVPITAATLLAALLFGGLALTLHAADTTAPAPAPTNSVAPAAAPAAKPAAVKKQLTGAELYSMHCNRCHPERYPTERTAAQWKTLMLHMEVRANIPPEQSKLILQYLQENSGR